ncbi:hypothetical protein QTP81_07425 [Alteromonas sp. ASW11-36]|uniref:Lipoprotein n=1 Tax=Alteromonas arenosi TaxID=3055817 RepID=A0ABT7SW56_9ALTE|nr:hypothetical protein [Alteromonas sp. ASW11-36]MDM7860422.1 hypothetical protein [Alteromonas sp. ASW11-36]
MYPHKLGKLTTLGIAVGILFVTSGCTTVDSSISNTTLDRETCAKLAARGVDCQNNQSLGTAALAHVEFHQQLLPIHQRNDILEAELDEYRGEH